MTGYNTHSRERRVSYREQRHQLGRLQSHEDLEELNLLRKEERDDFRRAVSSESGKNQSQVSRERRRSSVSSDEQDRHEGGRKSLEFNDTSLSSSSRQHTSHRSKESCERSRSSHSSASTKPRDEQASSKREDRRRDVGMITFATGEESTSTSSSIPRCVGMKAFDADRVPNRERGLPHLEVERTRSSQDGNEEGRKQPKAIRRALSEEQSQMDKPEQASSREKPERAVKYTFNHETEEWDGQRVYITLSERPFAQGGCRVCYKMTELHSDGSKSVLVAKMYKQAAPPETYFDEAMTQMLAEDYAKEFNRLGLKRTIGFLPVSVLKLSERGGQLVNAEPILEGKYVKHNDNDGHVDTDDMVPQAFSHFSWEKSRRKLLICDIQGVGDFYTDPQIHSEDGEGFGTGNMGMEGISRFFETHKCNLICKALQLRNSKFGSPDSSGCRPCSDTAPSRGASRTASTLAEAEAEEDSWTGSGSGRSVGRSRDQKALKSRLWSTGRNYGKALLNAVKSTLAPTASSTSSIGPPSPDGRSPSSGGPPSPSARVMRVSSSGPAPLKLSKEQSLDAIALRHAPPSSSAKDTQDQDRDPPQAGSQARRRRASVA